MRKNNGTHQVPAQIGKEDHWQNPENFFSGEVIFGGQNPKNAKKISKNFIVPNCSIDLTDHL